MSNMSYCRFENTTSDLDDCIDAVDDACENGINRADFRKSLSSDYERRAFNSLYERCLEFVRSVDNLDKNN